MSDPVGVSGPLGDRAAVADAVRRVVAGEGMGVLADARRFRALVVDELGSEGYRQRAAVDAVSGLAVDVGGRLGRMPPDQAGALLEGWATVQRHVDPGSARWAAGFMSGLLDLPGTTSDPWVPSLTRASGPSTNGRSRLLKVGAFLIVTLVAAGLGFVAGTATGEADAPTVKGSTSMSTTASPSTTTMSPPLLATTADLLAASITGTWDVTLTVVACTRQCPPPGTALARILAISCSAGECFGDYGEIRSVVAYAADRGEWILTGTLPEAASPECGDRPLLTTHQWILRVEEARWVQGTGWHATALAGQRTQTTPEAECAAVVKTWTVVAEPG